MIIKHEDIVIQTIKKALNNWYKFTSDIIFEAQKFVIKINNKNLIIKYIIRN